MEAGYAVDLLESVVRAGRIQVGPMALSSFLLSLMGRFRKRRSSVSSCSMGTISSVLHGRVFVTSVGFLPRPICPIKFCYSWFPALGLNQRCKAVVYWSQLQFFSNILSKATAGLLCPKNRNFS